MLSTIGVKTAEDLISYLPSDVRFDGKLAIEDGKSEYEIVDYFKEAAAHNANGYASFLGAGVYNHYRPVLVDVVVSRGAVKGVRAITRGQRADMGLTLGSSTCASHR